VIDLLWLVSGHYCPLSVHYLCRCAVISVAERLLELGEVNFQHYSFRVVKPTRQFSNDADGSCDDSQDDDDDDDDECEYDDAASAVRPSVVLSNIPESLSESYLTMFLENSRRSGGGDISDMQFDQKSATAVVIFANPQGIGHFFVILRLSFTSEAKANF